MVRWAESVEELQTKRVERYGSDGMILGGGGYLNMLKLLSMKVFVYYSKRHFIAGLRPQVERADKR